MQTELQTLDKAADQVLTVGIIGAGHVVSANHLPVLMAMDNYRVSWIADKDERRSRQVAKSYGLTSYDLQNGIANCPETDAVLLAIPWGVRAPYYRILAERKTAIYVEKPLARTREEHQKLCSKFPDYNLACGLNRRSWGIVQFCRQVISSHLLGPVRAARFGMGTLGGIAAADLYMADARLSGGGMLIETGVHGIDTVLYCLNAQEAKLTGGTMVIENGHDIHCDGTLSLTDQEGHAVPFEVEVSRLKNTINRVEFEFDYCTIFFSLFASPELFIENKRGECQSILTNRTSYYPFTWNQVLFEFWQAFRSAILYRSPNYTAASQSALSTEVIEKLYSLGNQAEGRA